MTRRVLLALCLLLVGVESQAFDKLVTVQAIPSVDAYHAGKSYKLGIQVEIEEGWHINSYAPPEEFLIPTEVLFSRTYGITFGRMYFPEPVVKQFPFLEKPLPVYEGEVRILTHLTTPLDLKPGTYRLRGELVYQACNDQICAPPDTARFTVVVRVVSTREPVHPINQDWFSKVGGTQTPSGSQGRRTPSAFEGKGILGLLVLVFLGGLALDLTPCVYPLIPITISYFGGQSQGRRGGLITHAVLYVIGMALMYSVLGTLAALTGSILGAALQKPLVLGFVALVLVGLALSMFGLYEIRLPGFLASAGASRVGYVGTLFMGLTVGLVAAPCIGPFVLGLMTYVGEKGNPLLGFVLFFVLALGLGAPFILLGIFSGAITRLPRAGPWMVWVRKIFGLVLIGMALYFLQPLFPSPGAFRVTILVLALGAGVYLAWLEGSRGTRLFHAIRYLVGLGVIAGSLLWFIPRGQGGEKVSWTLYSQESFQQALQQGKPILLDFYADWCISCKELDIYTFSHPEVIRLSQHFVMMKVDLTHPDSPELKDVVEKYRVKGLPTVIFLSPTGEELTNLRFMGFIKGPELLAKMKEALAQLANPQN